MKTYRTILIAPAICGALLAGIAVEGASRVSPSIAASYHARARNAINAIPTHVGTWTAKPLEVPPLAIALLHPNAILSLHYEDGDFSEKRSADLLIDQCRDARDMNGHYPHNCYISSGYQEVSAVARPFTLPGLPTFTLTEYQFRQTTASESTRMAVYNFLIVPDRGIFKDMDGVYRAGEDYQRRFYGAAQFQVVMNADLPQNERDDIFQTLIGPCVPAIQVLLSGGNP